MRTEDARRALWVLAILLVAAQPLSMVVGTWYLQRWGSAGNAYNQWSGYRAAAAPDVLFLGDSRVRLDIDTVGLSRRLGLTVASIGIDAAKPHFLEALATRIVEAPDRPRTVVIALSEYQLNASWDANVESGGALTKYFWQIGGPPDVGYVGAALRLDPERGRLLAGWSVPVFANYSVIVEGLRCDIAALRQRSDCVDEYLDRDRQMDAATLARWSHVIRDQYLGDYVLSDGQRGAAVRTADLLRARGLDVRFVILPVYRVPALAPDAYAAFRQAVLDIARAAHTDALDLHDAYDDHPELFFDPNHLTRAGAAVLADRLSRELATRR